MTIEVAAGGAAAPLARLREALAAWPHGDARGSVEDRVRRGAAGFVAVAGPALMLIAAPAFLADRDTDGPLALVSLVLAVGACTLLPVGLRRSAGVPSARWSLAVLGVFAVLVGLEAVELPGRLAATGLPWIVATVPFPAACAALSVRRTAALVAVEAVLLAAIAAVLGARLDLGPLAADLVALAGVALGSTVIIRALRARAADADAARTAAAARAESSARQIALERERARTDAAIVDSVLTTLLSAASAADADTRARAVRMAERSLAVVAAAEAPTRAARQTFGRAVAGLERELAAMGRSVQLDLAGARDVALPDGVADALVAATMQAVGNSLKYAGPMAARVVRAVPADGGVRVTIRDDGRGFDPAAVPAERLGVRITILGRMRAVGGSAAIRSRPGVGTTVVLAWAPAVDVR